MKPVVKVIITAFILVILVIGFYFATRTISAATGKSILGWVISGISGINSGQNAGNIEDMDDFAKCLTEKEAKIFIRNGCGYCTTQKELFGDSFQYLNSIECTEKPDLCSLLKGVPAWQINEEIIYGVQSLEELSRLSGC